MHQNISFSTQRENAGDRWPISSELPVCNFSDINFETKKPLTQQIKLQKFSPSDKTSEQIKYKEQNKYEGANKDKYCLQPKSKRQQKEDQSEIFKLVKKMIELFMLDSQKQIEIEKKSGDFRFYQLEKSYQKIPNSKSKEIKEALQFIRNKLQSCEGNLKKQLRKTRQKYKKLQQQFIKKPERSNCQRCNKFLRQQNKSLLENQSTYKDLSLIKQQQIKSFEQSKINLEKQLQQTLNQLQVSFRTISCISDGYNKGRPQNQHLKFGPIPISDIQRSFNNSLLFQGSFTSKKQLQSIVKSLLKSYCEKKQSNALRRNVILSNKINHNVSQNSKQNKESLLPELLQVQDRLSLPIDRVQINQITLSFINEDSNPSFGYSKLYKEGLQNLKECEIDLKIN